MKRSLIVAAVLAALGAIGAATLWVLATGVPAAAPAPVPLPAPAPAPVADAPDLGPPADPIAPPQKPAGREAAPAQPAPASALADRMATLLGLDPRADEAPQRLLRRLADTGEASVGERELEAIATSALSGSADGRALMAAAQPLRARYVGKRIELGTVIDLRRVDTTALSTKTAEVIDNLRQYASFLAARPLWVAVDTAPSARDSDLDLGSDLAVQLGQLTLPAAAAGALGLDDQLREALTLDLVLVDLQQIEVRDGSLYLQVTPRPQPR